MVPGAGQVRDCCSLRRHAGGERHCRDTALQGGQTVLERVLRRVGDAGVDRPRVSQREPRLRVLRVVEDVGGGHVDRLVACTEVRVDILAGVDSAGIKTPLACSAVVVLRHISNLEAPWCRVQESHVNFIRG